MFSSCRPQKNLRDKDFAELLGELSGAICLKTLVLLGSAPRIAQKILWCCSCDSLALGFFFSAPADGQQQQLKTTSDVTSKFPWLCRASVL